MEKFKAAVIGCGRAGSLFDLEDKRKVISSHCGAYKNCTTTNLISICDKDEKKLSLSSDYWGIKKSYLDYKDLFDSEEIDILSICTLPENHLEIIKSAVNKEVKAIYCEKPITKSLSEAKEILEVCKDRDVLLVINHQRRWSSPFIDLKNKIREKEYGEIQHINFYYTRGIYNSGSHLFDLMRMLFGEVQSVLSISSLTDFTGEPTISGILKFKNNYSALLTGLNGDNYRVFDLEIFFTKAKITIDGSLAITVSRPQESNRSKEFLELSTEKSLHLDRDKESPMVKAVNEIVGNLKEKGLVSCTGKDGYKSLELIHALQRSLENKKEVTLPLRL